MLNETSIAAATAVVGYDLAQDTIWQSVGYPRVLTGLGIKGSAAAGDTAVRVMIDTQEVGTFYNTGVGFSNNDDIKKIGAFRIPPYAQIHIYVTDAPSTNPINITVQTVE